MPVTAFRNKLYRALLPFLAPSTRGKYQVEWVGEPFRHSSEMIKILERHRFLGGVVYGKCADEASAAMLSIRIPPHLVSRKTLFRTASITKTAAAIVSMRLVEKGILPLHESIHALLPQREGTHLLEGITLHHLLSHRSGLQDTAAYRLALKRKETFHQVLIAPGTVTGAAPGTAFRYSNFGYGLVGCLWEAATGKTVENVMQEELLLPLQMQGTLDGSTLTPDQVMPVERVLPYRSGNAVTIPPLGKQTFAAPDPLHHFGLTAGSLYTDAPSLSRMMTMLQQYGMHEGQAFLSPASVQNMTTAHSHYGKASPAMSYGLGLAILNDPRISSERIIGHQGYAYGCAHGMFYGESSGKQLISLNGGCSEARDGMLGLCTLDLIQWAWHKEFPEWRKADGTGA